ncbi:hypothetical protein AB0910_21865 [Streptomyces sp. NPDC047002]|uniref:hypothetical protein n=1 Tax=Streptomyces sp. NPDC047002 TaxID=3155475 RepID=UPI00345260A6
MEDLTGAERFSPVGGGRSGATFAKAAASLSDGYTSDGRGDPIAKPACAVATPDGGGPELTVGFRTTAAGSVDGSVDDRLTRYGVGRGAYVGLAHAYVYFDCASATFYGSTREKPAVVLGELADYAQGPGRDAPKGGAEKVREANLTVLHSLSLAMAEELGCAGDGGLGAEPALTPVARASGQG